MGIFDKMALSIKTRRRYKFMGSYQSKFSVAYINLINASLMIFSPNENVDAARNNIPTRSIYYSFVISSAFVYHDTHKHSWKLISYIRENRKGTASNFLPSVVFCVCGDLLCVCCMPSWYGLLMYTLGCKSKLPVFVTCLVNSGLTHRISLNSLVPGGCGSNFKLDIFKLISRIHISGSFCFGRMLQDLPVD